MKFPSASMPRPNFGLPTQNQSRYTREVEDEVGVFGCSVGGGRWGVCMIVKAW